jgi:uncharacterized protein YkwD
LSRLAASAAVLALLAPAGAARAARPCDHARTPAIGASTTVMRAAVLCLINRERTSRGLPALRASRRLGDSAQRWTDHMVATGVFSHGSNFARRIAAAGYRWQFAGENIATGYATPRSVVDGWMASQGHCANILSPNYLNVGTGVSPHGVRGVHTGPSTWTQDFALPANRAVPSHNRRPEEGCP